MSRNEHEAQAALLVRFVNLYLSCLQVTDAWLQANGHKLSSNQTLTVESHPVLVGHQSISKALVLKRWPANKL